MAFPTIKVEAWHDGAWNDYGTSCYGYSLQRGRQRLLERHQAGTCTIVLDNSAGTFDPANSADMRPGMWWRIRVSRDGITYHHRFAGVATSFDVTWTGPEDSEVVISLVDGLALLALVDYAGDGTIPAGSAPSTAMDQIIGHALGPGTVHEGTYSGWVDVPFTESSTVQAMSAVTGNALELCQKVAEGEDGEFFAIPHVAASGTDFPAPVFRFVSRPARWLYSLAHFTDKSGALGAGEWPYEFVARARTTDDFVRNVASATTTGGTAQTAEDATSIDAWLRRPWSTSGLYVDGDTQALVVAEQVVAYRADPPVAEFAPITLAPHTIDDDDYWDLVLGLGAAVSYSEGGCIDFGSRVTVTKTPPYGSALERDCFVAGWSEEVRNRDGSQEWLTTLSLADAEPWPTTAWRIGDADYGKIGTASVG